MEWLVKFKEGGVLLTGDYDSYESLADFNTEISDEKRKQGVSTENVLQTILREEYATDDDPKKPTIYITSNAPLEIKDWFSHTYDGAVETVVVEQYEDKLDNLTIFEVEAQDMTVQDVNDFVSDRDASDYASGGFKAAKQEFIPRTKAEDTLFADFPQFTDLEKQYLDKKYVEKAKTPRLSSGAKNILTIFSSAGFGTALVNYGILEATAVGLMSLLLVPLFYLYLVRSRVELPRDDWNELYTRLESAVQENEAVDDSATIPIYVVTFGSGSPFTLPFTKPSIYIPDESFEELALDEFKAIFEHEIGHHTTALGYLSLLMTVISVNILAPVLVLTTPLTPSVELFGILLVTATLSEIAPKIYNRWGERKADSYVQNNRAFTRLLLRLSDTVHHVRTRPQRLVHRFIDVHPPINDRIQAVFTNNNGADEFTYEVPYDDLPKSYTVGEIIGTLLTGVGSVMIGIGLLAFVTSTGIPHSYLAIGVVSYGLGLFELQFIDADGSMQSKVKSTALAMVFLSSLVLFFGWYLGGDSLAEIIAFGYFGPTLGILILFLFAISVWLVYKILKPSKVDPSTLSIIGESWESAFIADSSYDVDDALDPGSTDTKEE